ncbi:MAG: DUF2142 domain-containing protein [Bacteroidales bacterium]|nr:DUF2142 domain-containing protein [Bacteroidales bacterium]
MTSNIILNFISSSKNLFLFFAISWGVIMVFLIPPFIGVVFIFSFTMYLSWTEVGAARIDNLQGRYFIPIVPLLLMLFYNRRWNQKVIIIQLVTIIYILISIAVTLYALINWYYL